MFNRIINIGVLFSTYSGRLIDNLGTIFIEKIEKTAM